MTQLMHIPASIDDDNISHIRFGEVIYRKSLSNNTHTHTRSHEFNEDGLSTQVEDETK